MTILGTVVQTVLAVSVTGASAVMLYMLFKKRDDDDNVRRPRQIGNSSRTTNLEIPIPHEAVGIVIGRQGCNIKNIQEKTKTKIKFRDEGSRDLPRICVISGSPESTLYAQELIQDLIRNQPLIITSEMTVPAKAVGRIIGRCGENVHAIMVSSGAKVNVENSSKQDQYAPRRVILKGTAEQIAVARSLIESKVSEEDELRRRYEAGAANRSPRKTTKSPYYLTAGDKAEADAEPPRAERLDPMSSDESLTVYMSAVETPGQFWVQILSPSAAELDQLVQQMTDYYSKLENQELHALHEISLGQLVAAPFHEDKRWYRAKIVEITPNEYEPSESEVELYYLDYGDSYNLEQNRLMELRTDFLKLCPQAIECSLAKVKPIDDKWSEESTDLFEELTFNAQWKVIVCKVDHYDTTIQRKQDRGRREGSPVPVVELFNISGPKDINIGDELVKNQFAVYTNPPSTSANSAVKPVDANSGNKSTETNSDAVRKKTENVDESGAFIKHEQAGYSDDTKSKAVSPQVVDKPESTERVQNGSEVVGSITTVNDL